MKKKKFDTFTEICKEKLEWGKVDLGNLLRKKKGKTCFFLLFKEYSIINILSIYQNVTQTAILFFSFI